ncbi:MAG: alanyl-tRNA editing protein [Clostridiales bacterium]|nr:alanyl-tRNA editing protein [Clostridiales bacterium]
MKGKIILTKRLFDENSYISEFTATVTDSIECDGFYKTVLDQTAFFAEGGGQKSDTGYLDNIPLFDVQEENGIIYHFTHSPIEKKEIKGVIDWEKRFNKMQNHSAEHVISGIVHTHYGYENTGFHLGDDVVTMDYSGPLNQEDIDKIEFLSNKVVWENRKITCYYPENTENLFYRSKLDIKENLRIVEIDGVDRCACCAPHVKETGEIGFIKIVSWQKYKGGVRLFMKAGSFAFNEINGYFKALKKLSVLLSLPMEETPAGVEKLMQKLNDTQYQLNGLKLELLKREINQTDCNFAFVDSADLLKDAVNLLNNKFNSICGAFFGNDIDGYRFNIITPDIEATKTLLKEKLNASGGGRDNMLQGKTNAKKEEIIRFFN